MDEQIYNRYLQLLNKRYRYDNTNLRLYGLILKLMAWQYKGGIANVRD
jgi:hypothetical protein